MAINVYKTHRNPQIATHTEMGRKVLVLKYIENNHDRKRTYNVRLRTLERKIRELEIMTGCHIHMDVLKTATNISSQNTSKKQKKHSTPQKEDNSDKHTAFLQHNNSAFFGEESHHNTYTNEQFGTGLVNYED